MEQIIKITNDLKKKIIIKVDPVSHTMIIKGFVKIKQDWEMFHNENYDDLTDDVEVIKDRIFFVYEKMVNKLDIYNKTIDTLSTIKEIEVNL